MCSDVASEGINLHYRCHRLIHYDMPWSLMAFQQRNGRIDRYGQTAEPEIVYLVSRSENETIQGDRRILEILKEKDQQAYKNIGDPSVFMNVHSIEAEEEFTEAAIARGDGAEEFDRRLTPKSNARDALLDLFVGTLNTAEDPTSDSAANGSARHDAVILDAGKAAETGSLECKPESVLSIFPDDFTYCEAALHQMREEHQNLRFEADQENASLQLDAPGDLEHRFTYFPREIWPENGRFELTPDKREMSRAIDESRRSEHAWPRKHYLWRQNPVVEWLNDRMLACFGRNEAPVLAGVPNLPAGTAVFAFSGMVPYNKSHPLVCVWCATVFHEGEFQNCHPLEGVLESTGLAGGQVPNRGSRPNLTALRSSLRQAVPLAQAWVRDRADELDDADDRKLNVALLELEALKERQLAHVESRLKRSQAAEALKQGQLRKKQREIDATFDDYLDWVEGTMTLATEPWIKLLCLTTGRT